MTSNFSLIALLIVLVVPSSVLAYGRWKKLRNAQQRLAEEALLAHRIESNNPDIAFVPEEAVLVLSNDHFTGSDVPWLHAHRIYRNSSGEYFLFIWEFGSSGMLTHLTRERAISALRPYPDAFRREFSDV